MKPESRKKQRAKALTIGGPRSGLDTLVENLRNDLKNLKFSRRSASASASEDDDHAKSIEVDTGAAPSMLNHGATIYDFSQVRRALPDEYFNIREEETDETRRLLITELEPKLQQMIFLEHAFISPILYSSPASPLSADEIQTLKSILN